MDNFETVPTLLVKAMLAQSEKVATQAEYIGNQFISTRENNRKILQEENLVCKGNAIEYKG